MRVPAAFNRIQRSHQNALETANQVIVLSLVAGLQFPVCIGAYVTRASLETLVMSYHMCCVNGASQVVTAVCGAVWLYGRINYCFGYPKGAHDACDACAQHRADLWKLTPSPLVPGNEARYQRGAAVLWLAFFALHGLAGFVGVQASGLF